MKTVLVTGSSGLIGGAIVEKFVKEKWKVIGVDNYTRSKLFGEEGQTKGTIQKLCERLGNIEVIEVDIRDTQKMTDLIKRSDAIVHCAAQPSHPKSLEIPMEDFQINAFGTLNLLEITRQHNPDIPFAFMSTNKVYGDRPNHFDYKIVGRRYENTRLDAFGETLPIDQCGHTPFGVSKAAADLYCQEYGINFGMKTATFRGGCLIGANQKAVEMHGFLGFFTKQILLGNKLKLYGGGYRVRDNIHSSDVAEVIYLWIKKPKPDSSGKFGKPYNLGGMRQNSVSIFETVDAVEAKTGLKAKYEEAPARESDHIWWISDMSKFKKDYPEWQGLTKDLDYIFNELLEHWVELYNLKIELREQDYFKKTRG